MSDLAIGTMTRSDKGPMAPPPELAEPFNAVATSVTAWVDVSATAHWDLHDRSRFDGVDFYVGERELGHIHLDGTIHLATSPRLGAALVAEGLAGPFRYGQGWVCADIARVGAVAAVALFRRNYERLLRV